MERSHRWELRSLAALTSKNQRVRISSAKFVSQNDFFGVGIGGALVSPEKMQEILRWIHPHLDPQKPRHLLGIGTIRDIFTGVEKEDTTPVLENYTRAYLHHLFRSRELLAYRLATIHNVHFMMDLMAQIRGAIRNHKFAKLKKEVESL